jgi:DNA-binding transcriptional LysR family regulator
MNIDNLKAFLEVTATGSFHKASENLFITQSAVSARIKSLEEQLNRKLFTRRHNGTVLTAGGIVLYKHAVSMVKGWELARQEVALPAGITDSVSLGLPMNHWESISMSWVDWMNNNASTIATRIQSDYSLFLLQELREGLIDLAILYEPQHSPDIIIEEFMQETLVLVANTPINIKESQANGYIFIDWGQSFKKQHQQVFPNIPTQRFSITMEMIALNHILQHGGSGYFIQSTVDKHMKNGTLHPVKGAPVLSVMTYLVVSMERSTEPSVKKAIEGLKSIQYYQENCTH